MRLQGRSDWTYTPVRQQMSGIKANEGVRFGSRLRAESGGCDVKNCFCHPLQLLPFRAIDVSVHSEIGPNLDSSGGGKCFIPGMKSVMLFIRFIFAPSSNYPP